MSTDTCPTVKIKSGNKSGHVIINESDFDPAKHERYEAPPAPSPVSVPTGALPPPPPVDPLAGFNTPGWRDFDVARLRNVAAAVSGRAVENKEQAVAVIEAALTKQ